MLDRLRNFEGQRRREADSGRVVPFRGCRAPRAVVQVRPERSHLRAPPRACISQLRAPPPPPPAHAPPYPLCSHTLVLWVQPWVRRVVAALDSVPRHTLSPQLAAFAATVAAGKAREAEELLLKLRKPALVEVLDAETAIGTPPLPPPRFSVDHQLPTTFKQLTHLPPTPSPRARERILTRCVLRWAMVSPRGGRFVAVAVAVVATGSAAARAAPGDRADGIF